MAGSQGQGWADGGVRAEAGWGQAEVSAPGDGYRSMDLQRLWPASASVPAPATAPATAATTLGHKRAATFPICGHLCWDPGETVESGGPTPNVSYCVVWVEHKTLQG